jgi:hypothetical protein
MPLHWGAGYFALAAMVLALSFTKGARAVENR